MKIKYDGKHLFCHVRGANQLNAKQGKVYAISTLVYDKDSCNMEPREGLDTSERTQMKSDELSAKSHPSYPDSQKPLCVRINNIIKIHL